MRGEFRRPGSRASLRGTLLGRPSSQRFRSAKDCASGATTTRTLALGDCVLPTLRQTWPRVGPEAAMCVRKISAQCVLQFTPSLAAGCVLHRPVSRVIHCSELSFVFLRVRVFSLRVSDLRGGTLTVFRPSSSSLASPSATPPLPFRREQAPRRRSRLGYRRSSGPTCSIASTAFRGRLDSPRKKRQSPGHVLSIAVSPVGKRPTVMILPQVHLRKPCYDFYFL